MGLNQVDLNRPSGRAHWKHTAANCQGFDLLLVTHACLEDTPRLDFRRVGSPTGPYLGECVQQIPDGPDARDLNRVLGGYAGTVHVDQGDGEGPNTALGQGEAEVHDRVELTALAAAARAEERGTVHALCNQG